jgi:hypothetical protein
VQGSGGQGPRPVVNSGNANALAGAKAGAQAVKITAALAARQRPGSMKFCLARGDRRAARCREIDGVSGTFRKRPRTVSLEAAKAT